MTSIFVFFSSWEAHFVHCHLHPTINLQPSHWLAVMVETVENGMILGSLPKNSASSSWNSMSFLSLPVFSWCSWTFLNFFFELFPFITTLFPDFSWTWRENLPRFPRSALERENWLAQLQEQGQFGQNQFYELTLTICELTDLAGRFWLMVSALGSMTKILHTASISIMLIIINGELSLFLQELLMVREATRRFFNPLLVFGNRMQNSSSCLIYYFNGVCKIHFVTC